MKKKALVEHLQHSVTAIFLAIEGTVLRRGIKMIQKSAGQKGREREWELPSEY
jgi:hypothetical protein